METDALYFHMWNCQQPFLQIPTCAIRVVAPAVICAEIYIITTPAGHLARATPEQFQFIFRGIIVGLVADS